MEYYDPAAVVTTEEGHLEITLSQMQTHGLDYQSGHVSSWNKFCFTGGYVEGILFIPSLIAFGILCTAYSQRLSSWGSQIRRALACYLDDGFVVKLWRRHSTVNHS